MYVFIGWEGGYVTGANTLFFTGRHHHTTNAYKLRFFQSAYAQVAALDTRVDANDERLTLMAGVGEGIRQRIRSVVEGTWKGEEAHQALQEKRRAASDKHGKPPKTPKKKKKELTQVELAKAATVSEIARVPWIG